MMKSSLLVILCFICMYGNAQQAFNSTGNVEIIAIDYPGHQSSMHVYHFYTAGSNSSYVSLLFDDPTIAPIKSGEYRIVGTQLQGSTSVRVISCDSTTKRSLRSTHSKRLRAQDNRSIVIVRISFTGKNYQPTPDVSAITNLFFTGTATVRGFYQYVSNGLINFASDSNGDGQPDIYSAAIQEPTICWDIPILAQTVIKNSLGVDIMTWQHHVMILPPDYTGCGYGVGNVGCTPNACNVYSNQMGADVYTHEIGHNLGLNHANSMSLYPPSTVPQWAEYTDYSSSMSLSMGLVKRGFNPINLQDLDLLPAANVVTLTSPVMQVQQVLQDLYSTSGTRVILFVEGATTYHVSFRLGSNGYDQNLQNNMYHPLFPGGWQQKVYVHRRDSTGTGMTFVEARLDIGSCAGTACNGAFWKSPGNTWAVQFSSISGAQAVILVGTPSQVQAGAVGGGATQATTTTTTTTTATTTTTRAPTRAPTQAPTTTTTTTTTRAPTRAPTQAPTTTTTTTTTRAPTRAPTAPPTTTTTRAPTRAPTTAPSTTKALVTQAVATASPVSGNELPIAPQGGLFAPARIQAEFFDDSFDRTPANLGGAFRPESAVDIAQLAVGSGFYVGWTQKGEWLEYKVNVQQTGSYRAAFRVASQVGTSSLLLTMDGFTMVGPLNIPNTGGWNSWYGLMGENSFQVTAGSHIFRVLVTRSGFNLDFFDLYQTDTEVSVAMAAQKPLEITYAVCGNQICEIGENCQTCSDCTGSTTNGNGVSFSFCCSGNNPLGYDRDANSSPATAAQHCAPPSGLILPRL